MANWFNDLYNSFKDVASNYGVYEQPYYDATDDYVNIINEEAHQKELFKPVNEWDDDYNDKFKLGNTEHDTMGYDYIATPYTISPTVQDVRNSGGYGGTPYRDYDSGYNCTTLFGKALMGTPFGGIRNVDRLVDKAKELGMYVPYDPKNPYTRYASDIEIWGNNDHATMVTENDGRYMAGKSAGGGYETDNRLVFRDPKTGVYPATGYITTHIYDGRKYPSNYLQMRDDFMNSIYGNPQRQIDMYNYNLAGAYDGVYSDSQESLFPKMREERDGKLSDRVENAINNPKNKKGLKYNKDTE